MCVENHQKYMVSVLDGGAIQAIQAENTWGVDEVAEAYEGREGSKVDQEHGGDV